MVAAYCLDRAVIGRASKSRCCIITEPGFSLQSLPADQKSVWHGPITSSLPLVSAAASAKIAMRKMGPGKHPSWSVRISEAASSAASSVAACIAFQKPFPRVLAEMAALTLRCPARPTLSRPAFFVSSSFLDSSFSSASSCFFAGVGRSAGFFFFFTPLAFLLSFSRAPPPSPPSSQASIS